MIATQRANSILDKLLREKTTVTTSEGTIQIPKYLGFSTTEPVLGEDGSITNFTEPAAITGYLRLQISEDAGADLDSASGAKITNSKYNFAFPVPDKGQQYGSAVAIGFFDSKDAPQPYFTAKLKQAQTLGLKTTLVIYKNDFSTTLTATETTATGTTGA